MTPATIQSHDFGGSASPSRPIDANAAVRQSPGRRGGALLLWTVGLIAAWAVFAVLGRHSFVPNADSANSVLAGRSLVSGNVFLRHWRLPVDSYWTSDLVLFGIWTRATGLSMSATWAVPAMVMAALTATVVYAVRAVAGSARAGWTAVAVCLVPVVLPSLVAATFMLQGPTHLGTLLWCLVAFALLAPPRPTWAWILGTVVLAVALVGDPTALLLGAGPVVAAGALQTGRTRHVRPLLIGVAEAAAAAGFALALRGLAIVVGGYRLTPAQPAARSGSWLPNLRLVPRFVGFLFGSIGPTPGVWRGPVVTQVGRTLLAAVFALGVFAVLVELLRGLWRKQEAVIAADHWIDDVCLMALLCDMAFFVIASLPPVDINSIRYLLPVLPLGAVLVGRAAARAQLRLGGVAVGATAVVAIVALVGGLVGYRHQIAGHRPVASQSGVAGWLEQHQMVEGISNYWEAAPITLLTKDRVRVRTAVWDGRRLAPTSTLLGLEVSASDHRPMTFVVTNSTDPLQQIGLVNRANAIATFGPPTSVVVVGESEILVWNHDLWDAFLGRPAG